MRGWVLSSNVQLTPWLMNVLGRHFSSAEILTLVATFVHLADVQVVHDSIQPDRTRVGLGAIPIKGNMRVKFSARSPLAKA